MFYEHERITQMHRSKKKVSREERGDI